MKKHYEVENKLLSLVKSLQTKQSNGTWDNLVHEQEVEYGTNSITPTIHHST
ncbi:MAG: hypothetical protein ROY99_09445 [Ignavibacterium sp.]|jgi:hypothetical protein|nr:hypothetical protein [Ignavibacterium sp.]